MAIHSNIARAALVVTIVTVVTAAPAFARNLISHDQAMEAAFPAGTKLEREAIFLTEEQLGEAGRRIGEDLDQELLIRYVGVRNGKIQGYIYFDAHRVRTLPETLMIVVTPESKIERIEVVAFSEPTDYFPRERWLEQFEGAELNEELSLKRSIRPITGATLTGRAITSAARRILALHTVIGGE